MLLFLSHVAVKIRGLCSVYIVYDVKPLLTHFLRQGLFWYSYSYLTETVVTQYGRGKIVKHYILQTVNSTAEN